MFIYIINLASIIIYALLANFFKHFEKVIYFIIGLQLFFISALRNTNVGTDLPVYLFHMYRVNNLSWNELDSINFEYGYVLLTKIISSIYCDEMFYIMITSAIIVIGFMRYTLAFSKMPWLSIFLLIALGNYTHSFNIIRQYIAIVIVLSSIKYIYEKKLLPFVLIVLIATMIHISALVFLILYPISRIKINSIYLTIIGLATFLVFLFKKELVNFIFAMYQGRTELNVVSGEGQGMLVLLSFVTICGLFFKDNVLKKDDKLAIFYHMMIISIPLQVLSLEFSLFVRVVTYFSIAMIIMIPNVIASFQSIYERIIAIMIVCFFTSVYFYVLVLTGNNTSNIIPYMFIWE